MILKLRTLLVKTVFVQLVFQGLNPGFQHTNRTYEQIVDCQNGIFTLSIYGFYFFVAGQLCRGHISNYRWRLYDLH